MSYNSVVIDHRIGSKILSGEIVVKQAVPQYKVTTRNFESRTIPMEDVDE